MAISFVRNLAILFIVAFLSACSMDRMIETMTSEEDREMAFAFVEDIRSGDTAGLEAVVEPDLWKRSASDFAEASSLFPDGDVETDIIAYSMNSSGLGENARTEKEFTLVTTNGEHWTTTRFGTLRHGGDQLITSWNVEGSDEPPAEIEMMESVGAVFMWVGIIGLLLAIGFIVLIVWLVRRSRRKDRERAGIS